MASHLARITVGILLSCTVWAETLVDPTRPPAQISNFETVSQVASVASSVLQSILISKARRAAIIDGKTIVLGQLHNGAKLVEVNESNVVLVGPLGRRVLKLFPEVKVTQKAVPPQLLSVQTDQNNNLPVKHKEQK